MPTLSGLSFDKDQTEKNPNNVECDCSVCGQGLKGDEGSKQTLLEGMLLFLGPDS